MLQILYKNTGVDQDELDAGDSAGPELNAQLRRDRNAGGLPVADDVQSEIVELIHDQLGPDLDMLMVGRDADGGFAEYVAAPASHVFRLPDSIDSRTAPLVQVLTTCLHAQRQVNIFPAESVVVFGLGVTGQLHVQLAKARGASPVIGVTRSAAKRELAQTLGADLTVPGGDGAVDTVREATEGRGADVVIETTGVLASVAAAVAMARPGGRVLLFGIITAKEGALPFYDLYFKELALVSARVAKSEDYPAALALVEREQIKLEPLVSDVMPLAELDTAIGMLGSDSARRMKIILDHG